MPLETRLNHTTNGTSELQKADILGTLDTEEYLPRHTDWGKVYKTVAYICPIYTKFLNYLIVFCEKGPINKLDIAVQYLLFCLNV